MTDKELEKISMEVYLEGSMRDLQSVTRLYQKGVLGEETYEDLRKKYLENIADVRKEMFQFNMEELNKKIEVLDEL